MATIVEDEVKLKISVTPDVSSMKKAREQLLRFAKNFELISQAKRAIKAEDLGIKKDSIRRMKELAKIKNQIKDLEFKVKFEGADPRALALLTRSARSYANIVNNLKADEADLAVAKERYNRALKAANQELKKSVISQTDAKAKKALKFLEQVSGREIRAPRGPVSATGLRNILKQTQAIEKMKNVLSDMNAKLKQMPDGSTQMQKLNDAFQNFVDVAARSDASIEDIVQAQVLFNASLRESREALKNYAENLKTVSVNEQYSSALEKNLQKQGLFIDGLKNATGATRKQLEKQQTALLNTAISYKKFVEEAKRLGASNEVLAQASKNFEKFKKAMQSGPLTSTAMKSATLNYKQSMNALQLAMKKMKDAAASEAANKIQRLLERVSEAGSTAQIALGPLSGVASRLTAFVSLARKTNLEIAGLLTTLVGLGAALFFVGRRAIFTEKMLLRLQSTVSKMNFAKGSEKRKQFVSDLENIADEVDKLTLADKAQVLEGMTGFLSTVRLPNFTKDAEEQTKNLIRISMLAATAMTNIYRGQFASNARRLARVLEDPLANLESLKEVGIQFTNQEKLAIQKAEALGDRIKSNTIILRKFLGIIQDSNIEAQGAAGAFDSLMNTISTLPDKILGNENMRLTKAIATAVNNFNDSLKKLIENMNIVSRVSVILTATVKVLDTIFQGLMGTLNFITANPITSFIIKVFLLNKFLKAVVTAILAMTPVIIRSTKALAAMAIAAAKTGLALKTMNLKATISNFKKFSSVLAVARNWATLLASILILIIPDDFYAKISDAISRLLGFKKAEEDVIEKSKEFKKEIEDALFAMESLTEDPATQIKRIADRIAKLIKEGSNFPVAVLGRINIASALEKIYGDLAKANFAGLKKAIEEATGGSIKVTKKNLPVLIDIVLSEYSKMHKKLREMSAETAEKFAESMITGLKAIGVETNQPALAGISELFKSYSSLIKELQAQNIVGDSKALFNELESLAIQTIKNLQEVSSASGGVISEDTSKIIANSFKLQARKALQNFIETIPAGDIDQLTIMIERMFKTIDDGSKATLQFNRYQELLNKTTENAKKSIRGYRTELEQLVDDQLRLLKFQDKLAGTNLTDNIISETLQGFFIDKANEVSNNINTLDNSMVDLTKTMMTLGTSFDVSLEAAANFIKTLQSRGILSEGSKLFANIADSIIGLNGRIREGMTEVGLKMAIDEAISNAIGRAELSPETEQKVRQKAAQLTILLMKEFSQKLNILSTRENNEFLKALINTKAVQDVLKFEADNLRSPYVELNKTLREYGHNLRINGKFTEEHIQQLVEQKKHELELNRILEQRSAILTSLRDVTRTQPTERAKERIPGLSLMEDTRSALDSMNLAHLGDKLTTKLINPAALKKKVQEFIDRGFIDAVAGRDLKRFIEEDVKNIGKEIIIRGEEIRKEYDDLVKSIKEEGPVDVKQINTTVENVKRKLGELKGQLKSLGLDTSKIDEMSKAIDEGIVKKFNMIAEITEGIEKAFERAGQGIVDALLRGKDLMSVMRELAYDIAESLISSMLKTTITDQILPFIKTGTSSIVGSFLSFLTPSAKGSAYVGGVRKFAKGGLVNSPALAYSKGGPILMGEAGTEAVLPLERKNGILGVRASTSQGPVVNVIINNETDGNVKVDRQPTMSGEDIVVTIMKDAVGRGKLDDILGVRFQLRPKGR